MSSNLFAFVRFYYGDEAARAIQEINGKELDLCRLHIFEARIRRHKERKAERYVEDDARSSWNVECGESLWDGRWFKDAQI